MYDGQTQQGTYQKHSKKKKKKRQKVAHEPLPAVAHRLVLCPQPVVQSVDRPIKLVQHRVKVLEADGAGKEGAKIRI